MTKGDVENMLRIAREKGRYDIEAFDVRAFLAAKKILQSDPSHAAAKEIVKDFLNWMSTGVEPVSFTQFTLPIALTWTDEDLEEHKRIRDEHLAWKAEHAG